MGFKILPLELTIKFPFLEVSAPGIGGQTPLGTKSHPKSGIAHQGL